IKLIDSFCAQANQAFLGALRKEIDEVIGSEAEVSREMPHVPVSMPEAMLVSRPAMACEAKLGPMAPQQLHM
ncbi:MAG: hypothetical protein WC375_04985, partial [Methanomassiliicoccales archaeon]